MPTLTTAEYYSGLQTQAATEAMFSSLGYQSIQDMDDLAEVRKKYNNRCVGERIPVTIKTWAESSELVTAAYKALIPEPENN